MDDMNDRTPDETQLQEIAMLRERFTISEPTRTLLRAMAAADGYDDMWTWAVVEDGRRIADWFEDVALHDWNAIEVAQVLVRNAFDGDSDPWHSINETTRWSEPMFREDVLQYFAPGASDNEFWSSPECVVLVDDLIAAALAHDGVRARVVARQMLNASLHAEVAADARRAKARAKDGQSQEDANRKVSGE